VLENETCERFGYGIITDIRVCIMCRSHVTTRWWRRKRTDCWSLSVKNVSNISQGSVARQSDGRTDGLQTVTLRFTLSDTFEAWWYL